MTDRQIRSQRELESMLRASERKRFYAEAGLERVQEENANLRLKIVELEAELELLRDQGEEG